MVTAGPAAGAVAAAGSTQSASRPGIMNIVDLSVLRLPHMAAAGPAAGAVADAGGALGASRAGLQTL